jgi:kojibiose phosphorylase
MRAARADLFDVRNNAGDGIHGASAGGLWQAVVFGFAGLERTAHGWKTNPHLPKGWKCVSFKIVDQGRELSFNVKRES